jgi:hypothetical protein
VNRKIAFGKFNSTESHHSSLNLSGLLMLQVAFGFGYIGARALALGLRSPENRWMVPGEYG